MAKLRGSLELLVYTDDIATNNPKCKIMDVKKPISDDTVDQFQPLLIQVADATTDQVIAMNGLVGEYFILVSDQIVSIKLNGSGDAIQCAKMYIDGSSISSLSISNASGSVANVTIGFGQ